ncbi:MAG TPA: sodium:proton antiporter [Oscillatoriaceae cyanobacterium]
MFPQLLILLELLATATLVALVARRLRVPYSSALVVTGLFMSAFALVPNVALSPDVIIYLFLPVLLFESALNTDATALREHLAPVLLLSTLGMGTMAAITGAVLHLGLGWNWPVALLVGSLLSVTDTVAVLAIFKDLQAPPALTTIVESESLFNDGTALVLYRVLLGVVLTGTIAPAQAVIQFVWVAIGGLAIGGAIGLVASWVLKQTRDHLTEIMLTTFVALGSFFVAQAVGVSGVVAVVTVGLIVGNYGWRRSLSPTSQVALGSFWEYAGFGVNSAVFLLVGLNLSRTDWIVMLPAILVAYFGVFLGRICTIYPAFWLLNRVQTEPTPLRWQHLMVWGNLKGSLTMALTLSLPLAVHAQAPILSVVFGVVLISLLLQGLTLGPLVRLLGLVGLPSARALFEREQLKVIAARAAQNELKTLLDAGMLPRESYERLRSRYQVAIARSERELRRLGSEFPSHSEDVLDDVRHRLLLVEKGAVLGALRQRLISAEVAQAYLAELDKRLVNWPELPAPEPETE